MATKKSEDAIARESEFPITPFCCTDTLRRAAFTEFTKVFIIAFHFLHLWHFDNLISFFVINDLIVIIFFIYVIIIILFHFLHRASSLSYLILSLLPCANSLERMMDA